MWTSAQNRRTFFYLASIICFLLANGLTAFSQAERARIPFDSWGEINGEDASARLDNFAVQLSNEESATGVLVCYAPEGEGPGTGKFILKLMKEYLVNTRGLPQNRVETIYGGRYKDVAAPFIEAWIVPFGEDLPKTIRYESKLPIQRGKIRDFVRSDEISEISDECACGPSQGDVKLAALAEAIRNQPSDIVYLVAYNLPASAPGTWRRVAKREIEYVQGFGIDGERIKSVFGGTIKDDSDVEPSASDAKIQLWVLPGSADPPVKAAKDESSPTEAIKLGEYNDHMLRFPDEEKRVFERVADVIQTNRELRICFIVRPSIPNPGDPEVPVGPDDPPDPGIVKLIEKWKLDLVGKSHVDNSRVLIIPAAADEENQGSVEVWLLPPGIAVPNPYALRKPSQ